MQKLDGRDTCTPVSAVPACGNCDLLLKVPRGKDGVPSLKTLSNNGKGKRKYNHWTDEEKEYLKNNYLNPSISKEDLESMLNHSWNSILDMAKKLGVAKTRRDNEWRRKHSRSLKEGYRTGKIKSQKGIAKMSEEARGKIREANIGINNPMFDKHRSEKPSDHYHNGGQFYSKKNNKNLHYRSLYELLAYKKLEDVEEVIGYEIEPFSIKYIGNAGYERNYTPDILVHYFDGHKEIVEVKPIRLLQFWDNPAKLKALTEYVDKQDNMSMGVWTETEIGIK